jgi:hypothetical protein
MECRRWSLIPQSSKFDVLRATNLNEALGSLPSIAESTGREADEGELDEAFAVGILHDAIKGRPAKVVDKSRLRYVLYRCGPSRSVLKTTLDLLPRYPEHIDAFVAYLQNYSRSRLIVRLIWGMLNSEILYDYVEAELWMIASRIGTAQELRELVSRAQAQAKRRPFSFSMRRGLLTFFMSCRNAGVYSETRAIQRLRGQSPYIQSLVLHQLIDVDFKRNGVAAQLIQNSAPNPGMVLAGQLVQRNVLVSELGVQADGLAPEVRNVFQGLGLIEGQKKPKFDQIGDLLRNCYGVAYWRGWKGLLGENYQHALQLSLTADNKFKSDRSGWLSSQNSFNDAVFRAFQAFLHAKNLPGAVAMLDPKNRLHPFGRLLDQNTDFSKAFPTLSACLRAGNDRRNSIPDSHPFEFKSLQRTKRLKVRERDALKGRFATAYSEIIAFVTANS